MTDPSDSVRVTVSVAVEPEIAFQVFTEDINLWWRRGRRYRIAPGDRGILHLEPKLGGRLFESFDVASGQKVVQTGEITVWEPPHRVVFDWRAVNFAPSETTHVEILFEPTRTGTRVTLTHTGWSKIRPDHPVRHGEQTQAFLRSLGMWWGDLLTAWRVRVASSSSNEN